MLTKVINFPETTGLKKLAIRRGRYADGSVEILFNRKPTEDEFRLIDDMIEMMVNKSGVSDRLR